MRADNDELTETGGADVIRDAGALLRFSGRRFVRGSDADSTIGVCRMRFRERPGHLP